MNILNFKNGDTLPSIGLGTWLSKRGEVEKAVIHALETGYRHIDCAYIYDNEKEIGNALQYAFKNGIVKREEVFVTSKLWNSFHHPESVEVGIRKSLSDLQLDYLNLYLIHWPLVFKKGHDQIRTADDLLSPDIVPLTDTWKAMEKLQKSGLTHHIGVSNFSIQKLDLLCSNSEIQPELNQIEIHPFFSQEALVQYCESKQILVTAYSPLGSRHLTKTEENIQSHPLIAALALKYKCTPVQIILAWGMQRKYTVIPKSINKMRIIENFGAQNIQMSDQDIKAISAINRNQRVTKGLFAVLPGGFYSYENIWDEEVL